MDGIIFQDGGIFPIDRYSARYICDRFSTLKLSFSVTVNDLPIIIGWESQSGRIYKIDDTDIDPSDIQFCFEELDIAWMLRYMKPKNPLPFKLRGLSYDLIVELIQLDCHIEINLTDTRQRATESYIETINQFISGYNEKSESQNRKMGIIHNWNFSFDEENIYYDIDLGSTGPDFMKKLLMMLSDLGAFKKIRIN